MKLRKNKGKSTIKNLLNLWKYINRRRKRQLIYLLILMNISGIMEIFTLAAVIPFFNILLNPERVLENKLIIFLGISNKEILFFIVPMFFGILALISSLIRIFNLWANGRIASSIGADISIKCFEKVIKQDYSFHLKQNSNEVINTLNIEMSRVPAFFDSVLKLISTSIILFCLLITMSIINWEITFVSAFIIGSTYSIILFLCKGRLRKNSKNISESNDNLIKYLQEGLGSIKDLILNQNYPYYTKKYEKIERKIRYLQIENKFLAIVPRFGIEGLVLFLVSIYTLILLNYSSSDLKNNIAVIGTLILGAQRVLPLIQLIYAALIQVQALRTTLIRVLEYLHIKEFNYVNVKNTTSKFTKDIEFKNVSFKYEKVSKFVLDNISINILKGERIGIMGKSGSGKSTLVDLIMGLHKPSKGLIYIDGKDINSINNFPELKIWHKSISHMSQKLFFTNSSIKENIAFGFTKKEIDMKQIKKVSNLAKISDYVESLPYGYETIVGEGGGNLSGGQLQRIALARALYRNPKVLIFDEITSALDKKTEEEVLSSIQSLDEKITIIMIAHSKSTLRNCDRVIEIENGKIKKILNKSEFIK